MRFLVSPQRISEKVFTSNWMGSNLINNVSRYKLVFLGEQSTGKTSLITRYVHEVFDDTYQATIGIDFLSKTICIGERSVRLQLWDTAGQERFRNLIPSYIRDSNVAIVVYDITNIKTFQETSKWINDVRSERSGANAVIVLVGNKNDLEHKRQVSVEAGRRKAQDMNVMFTETSAKSGQNVKELFHNLINELPNKTESQMDRKSIFIIPPEDVPHQENCGKGQRCWC